MAQPSNGCCFAMFRIFSILIILNHSMNVVNNISHEIAHYIGQKIHSNEIGDLLGYSENPNISLIVSSE